MKSLNKLIIAILLLLPFSCDFTKFDEKLDNPNAATTDNADADLLFNSMQLSFANFFGSANGITEQAMRLRAMQAGFDYNSAYGSATGNTMWNIAYSQIFPDYDAFIAIAEPAELTAHVGAAKVMKAYVLMTLVDFFGDIPYSEAGQGIAIPSPVADDASGLYDIAKTLLDEAVAILDPAMVSKGFPGTDLFYGGDTDNRAQWRRAANSLLMKWAMAKQDGGVFTSASAGAINSNADDFDFHYGNNFSNPNSRHPNYNAQYNSGDGPYMSNYLMWAMRGGEPGSDKTVTDPRIRYYFYRQTDTAEGEDQFTIDCPFRPRPAGYSARDPFCLATNLPEPEKNHDGYWGRDHGDADGIPPDGQLRSVWGVYPSGGLFDDDTFLNTKTNGVLGGLGEGIRPVMDASFVDFMRAEATLTGLANMGDPKTLMMSGVMKSITKTMDYSASILTIDPAFEPSAADITAYTDDVSSFYDNATDPLDAVMREFHIASFGSAIEIWNGYKRTGYPGGLQPVRDGGANAPFPHMFLYPSNYVDLNQNAVQRDFGDKVFWDTFGKTLN